MTLGAKKRSGYARFGASEDDGPMRDVQCCDCGLAMQVTTYVWELAKLASSSLVNRGQPPLRNDEITRCKPCGELWCARKLEESLELERRIGQCHEMAKERGEYPHEARRWLLNHGELNEVRLLDERCRKFKQQPASSSKRKARDL